MEFNTTDEIQAWLKEMAKCTILTFSLLSSGAALYSNMPMTPDQMGTTISRQDMVFGDGPYRVEISTQPTDDTLNIELSLENKMVIWWANAKLRRSKEVIGGHPELINALADFDYVMRENKADGIHTGTFIVPLPSDPLQLQELCKIANAHGISWAVEDGSGVMHEGNFFMGGGAQPSSKRKANT